MTSIENPEPPAAPTATSSMTDYVNNYPRLFELMKQYAPQEAQMNVDLTQQYALPMAQALKSAQDAMYPNETALTNQLTQQVQQGMSGQLPEWARNQYLDTQKSLLGENALSGAGADYMSTGLNEQSKNWQDYYTNLGLSITGRQPVYNASQTGFSNQLGGYTPGGVANANNNAYGSYAGAYSNMYNTNATFATNMNKQYTDWGKMAAGGASGGMGGGGMQGFMGGL